MGSGLILKLEGGELAILEATGGATGPKKTAGQGGLLGLLRVESRGYP